MERARLVLNTVKRSLRLGYPARAAATLQKIHPSDVATILSHLLLPEERDSLIPHLPPEVLGAALPEMEEALARRVLTRLDRAAVTRLVQGHSKDDMARLLRLLPDEEADALVAGLEEEGAHALGELMVHDVETAGGIMDPDVFALSEDLTVAEAIRRLRATDRQPVIFYIYVVNDHGHLVGVCSLRQLLQTGEEATLRSIMATEVISAAPGQDREEVAGLIAQYDLLALPVVDEDNRLVGVITVDDVIDVLQEEATEDFYKMAGLDRADRVFTSPWVSFRKRLPWLLVYLGTGLIPAAIVSLFQGTLQQAVYFAAFMSIIAGMGGNAGSQTITVIIRGLVLGELTRENARRAVIKELTVNLFSGLVLGLLIGVAVYLWQGTWFVGAVVCLALFLNLIVAGVVGVSVPLALRRLNLDPALASHILVTTFTDAFGFLALLGLGTLAVKHLA